MEDSKSTRRTFLAGMAALASAAVVMPAVAAPEKDDKKTTTTGPIGGEKEIGPFALPALGYAFNVLEPHIDAKTMEIHHGKHHAAYVDKLNAALKGHDDLSKKTIEDLMADLNSIPEDIRNDVRNNGGGHINHTMFWEIMTPGGAKEPGGELAKAINSKFGSLDSLKKQFNETGTKRFGSGWAWLVRDKSGNLAITSTPNQDTPISEGAHPILGNDVWEHAYYLKYQNKRADYLAAWWNVVNWDKVAERFQTKASS